MPAGVSGLGLVGHSIIACLLLSGHAAVTATRSMVGTSGSRRHIQELLQEMRAEALTKIDPEKTLRKLRLSEDYADPAGIEDVLLPMV